MIKTLILKHKTYFALLLLILFVITMVLLVPRDTNKNIVYNTNVSKGISYKELTSGTNLNNFHIQENNIEEFVIDGKKFAKPDTLTLYSMDQKNVIDFVFKYNENYPATKIDQIIAESGKPDLIFISAQGTHANEVAVYLTKGKAYDYNKFNRSVEFIMDFLPTSEQDFMTKWGWYTKEKEDVPLH